LERFVQYLSELLLQLRALGARVLVLGLLPVGEASFPDSPASFAAVNEKLREVVPAGGAEFFDWASLLPAGQELFYRDSLHPNEAGARVLAEILNKAL
jgi:lysophospholipase L1-like esterase